MAQRKTAQGGDQYKRFVEAARKLGTDESAEELRQVAKSHPQKAKKAATKRKA
jgi:hypothetical protein